MNVLFISTHFPYDSQRSATGTYKRMRVFLDALKERVSLRLLFYYPPYLNVSGRSIEDAKATMRHEWGLTDVDLVVSKQEREPDDSKNLWDRYVSRAVSMHKQLGFVCTSGPEQLRIFERCLEDRPDFIFAHRLMAMCPALRTRRSLPPIFLDLDDVEHKAFYRDISQPPLWGTKRLYYLQLPAMLWGERRAIKLARKTFVCSTADQQYLVDTWRLPHVKAIPNSIHIPEPQAISDEPVLMFLGGYGYTPNAIAAEYTGYAFLVRAAAEADARAVAAGDLPRNHWFWSVVKVHWRSYGHIALAALLTNILALATPLFTMSVYDRVVPNGAIPSLIALSIGMGLAIAFDFLFRMVRSRMIDVTGKTVDVVLAANIFEHVMAVKMAQRPSSVGIIANQLRDFDSAREFFTSGSVVSATDLMFAVLFIGVLFIIAGPLAWIPLIMLPIMIVIGFVLQRPLDRAMKRLQAESAARHGVLVESLSGLETVRATGAEARMQTAWERSVAATARSGEDVHFWSSLSLTSANVAQQITSLSLLVIGVFLILDGKLTVGALVAANMLAGRVLAPIAGIASVITRGTQTLSSLKSIDRIMSLERERSPERAYVSRKIEEGRIAFENVSFAYPNAPGNALEKVSFKIEGGERVGIIGRVGSGKTTVGRLLLGFYEAKEGRILIDGVDSRQYDPADLRTGIGFAMQDIDLFFGKLRDNIALGKPEATETVGAPAHNRRSLLRPGKGPQQSSCAAFFAA
jgi:ABC-type protease/lipase transport system fused ATPase/permease subunit